MFISIEKNNMESALLSNNCFSETLFNARTFSYDNVGITTKVIRGRKLGLIDHISENQILKA